MFRVYLTMERFVVVQACAFKQTLWQDQLIVDLLNEKGEIVASFVNVQGVVDENALQRVESPDKHLRV